MTTAGGASNVVSTIMFTASVCIVTLIDVYDARKHFEIIACTPTQFQLVQIIYIMLCTSVMSLHFLFSTARVQSMYKLLPTMISNLNHHQASASVHKLSLYIGWQVVYCHAIMTYLIRNVWCYIASRKPHVIWFIAHAIVIVTVIKYHF